MLAISYVLGVSPLHMFVPLSDAERLAVGDRLDADAKRVREWVRGRDTLAHEDVRFFQMQLPTASAYARDALLRRRW